MSKIVAIVLIVLLFGCSPGETVDDGKLNTDLLDEYSLEYWLNEHGELSVRGISTVDIARVIVSEYPNLRSLTLKGCKCKDMSFLNDSPKLRSLKLIECTEIAFASASSSIRELEITQYDSTSGELDGLGELSELRILRLEGSGIRNGIANSLSEVSSLKSFVCLDTQLADFHYVANWGGLRSFRFIAQK